MNATTIELSPREQAAQARRAKDEARGYRINFKYLGIAAAGEVIVILTSLYGAWLFAEMYGSGNTTAMHMMMLAPLGYAVIEMSRVPLAVASRTQRNYFIKGLCFLGVIAAAGVTVKSMSQLGEIMFRPRLIQVTETHHVHKEAVARRDAFQTEFQTRKAAVDQASANLTTVSETSAKQVDALNDLGKPQTCPVTIRERGRPARTVQRPCPESAASKAVRATITDQQGTVTAARERVDEATRAMRALGTAQEVEANVVKTKKAFDNAVLHSQLHAFTGMFFAKDPAAVTESELSGFLRVFVFVPAVCVSLAGTILAMASVTRVRPPKAPKGTGTGASAPAGKLAIPVEGLPYILGPITQTVRETAAEAARQTVRETMDKRHPAPKRDLKVVAEGDR